MDNIDLTRKENEMITLSIVLALMILLLSAVMVLAIPLIDVIVALGVLWIIVWLFRIIFGRWEVKIIRK